MNEYDDREPSQELLDALARYSERRRQSEDARRTSRPKEVKEVKVALVRMEEVLPNGRKRSILTCIDGRYLLWRDFLDPRRWRWAQRAWPDDDRGTASHGAGPLDECVMACVTHFVQHNPGKPIPVE